MRQSLQLRLGQSLTMTPQLQQAIRLLQLSSLDLQAEIQSVLESNLMLETAEEAGGDDLPAELPTVGEAPSTAEAPATAEVGEVKAATGEGSDEAEPALYESPSDNLPDDLPVDSAWEDVYDVYDGATSYSKGDDDEQQGGLEQRSSTSQSLRDYLVWQIELSPCTPKDRAIALAIIDAIDDGGYLATPLEDIHQGLQDPDIELDEVEAVLKRVQGLDPPGVGARHPGECLRLQLLQLPLDIPWRAQALTLVNEHLEALANRDFNSLLKRLGVNRDELQAIIRLIQRLNPHPGTQHAADTAQYVVPDVFVYRYQGSWRVELNPDTAPKLRINSHYSSLIRRADNSADNVYLKNHLQEARWFLKSLKNRNETLLRVATAIVERQREFLERGEEYMKPLVLRDIAESMEMHESTISRVTTQKYMRTPRGIYEFKYFFSSHVATSDGGERSSVAIRAMIKKLISAENPRKPLSDSKIAQMLQGEGIEVARRTVAKYRELMAIPSSSDRKQLA